MELNFVIYVSQNITSGYTTPVVKVGSLLRQELIVLHLGASEVLAFVSPNHLRSQRCKFNFLFV